MPKYNKSPSWETIHKLCVAIMIKVRNSPMVRITHVYGVPRGGLIPAVLLSHLLEVPLALHGTDIKKGCLIIDDISDTGGTFKKMLDILTVEFQNRPLVYTAALYSRKDSVITPDFVGKYVNDNTGWIHFPWETLTSSKFDNTKTI